jgi:hypothetical protein
MAPTEATLFVNRLRTIREVGLTKASGLFSLSMLSSGSADAGN